MSYFKVEAHHSSSWIQRMVNSSLSNRGTSHAPLLGSFMYSDAPVMDEKGSLQLLKSQEQKSHENQGSRLLQLSPDLLLLVLLHLPLESLYMVRQTCRVLRCATDDAFELRIVHHRGVLWDIPKSEFDQLSTIKRIFQRASLCKPCGNLYESGELEKRLWTLWQPVYCTGCKRPHPAFLFPQGKPAGNMCVGLTGHFAPCKHVKITGRLESSPPGGNSIACAHPEHSSVNKRFAPRLWARSGYGPTDFSYSRGIPLVKIRQYQFPGMQILKLSLLKQLEELNGDGLCQHASSQLGSIVTCLVSDDCDCFPASGIPMYDPICENGRKVCCPNHGYHCLQCGARYFWGYEKDYIVLFVRIETMKLGPENSVWLANLRFDTDEHPIFNDNTKGVLWCNDPACGTSCGGRWLMMTFMLKNALQWGVCFGYTPPVRPPAIFMTLEYQVYRDAANWLGSSGMPRDMKRILQDCYRPATITIAN